MYCCSLDYRDSVYSREQLQVDKKVNRSVAPWEWMDSAVRGREGEEEEEESGEKAIWHLFSSNAGATNKVKGKC